MHLAARTTAAAFGAEGVVLLVRPDLPATAGLAAPDLPRGVVRLLGARRVVQAGLELAVPRRGVALACAAVDALHALSMLAAAAHWPRHRRAALLSAGTAALAAAAQYRTAPPSPSRSGCDGGTGAGDR
jgi:hypothetical protein